MRWRSGILMAVCGAGWLVLAGSTVAPVVGILIALARPDAVPTDVLQIPAPLALAWRSLLLSAVAMGGALLLGVGPGVVLALSKPSRRAWLVGLTLAPLLIPPQVYAYAWGLIPSGPLMQVPGGMVESVKAGLISAGWLWPIVTLFILVGYVSSGRQAFVLALLDASSVTAFRRAVLPSLRPYLGAAAAIVGLVTLVEYPIPHLVLARVWSTELLLVAVAGAPAGQVARMALPAAGAALLLVGVAAMLIREVRHWQALSPDETTDGGDVRLLGGASKSAGPQRQSASATGAFSEAKGGWRGVPLLAAWVAASVVWLGTVGVPVGLMLAHLRVPADAWVGIQLVWETWLSSLAVAAAAGLAAVWAAMGTVVLARAGRGVWAGRAAWLAIGPAIVPPAALGIGYIVAFNRNGVLGYLYTETPVVWVLGLAGRYSVLVVLAAGMVLGQRGIAAVDQARVDGAGAGVVLSDVLLPLVWPVLLAGGLVVMLLSMFEVVVTQLIEPVGYPSIAMTILNQMHYGRDDTVIVSSVAVVVGGVLVALLCGRLIWGGMTMRRL